ncbi:MAG: hypothetical protein IJ648_03295, partial [Lachnospiraceae bacterium]|nr:hypothetical protein [Lachnospiraceae bacterium]
MCFGFSYIGLIWLVMLLVPNIIWTRNKPVDSEKYVVKENKLLLAMERTDIYADCITAPKVELYLMEGCGHSPQGQLPEEFSWAVKRF